MYIDLYDTSVVGCSNKTDRDSNSEYKKKCKPRKCLIYTSYWRRDRLSNLYFHRISKNCKQLIIKCKLQYRVKLNVSKCLLLSQ